MRSTAVLALIAALAVGLLYRYWPTSCLCHIRQRLDGRVALVTDGSSFMGFEITSELARRGAIVFIGSQSREHFDLLCTKILHLYGDEGERVTLDFADEAVKGDLSPVKKSQLRYAPLHMNSLKSLKGFARELTIMTDRLDFLINNAAVSHGPYRTTMDGYESTMGIGHLAHYLLTESLRPLLEKSKPGSRIIIISSAEHTGGSFKGNNFFIARDRFNSIKAFAHVKLANVIHGVMLAEDFKGTSVIPVSVHPGYVLPELGMYVSSLFGAFFKSRWEAGQSVLYVALAPQIMPGGYYSNCQLAEPSAESRDKAVVEFVRKESDRLIGLKT